MITKYLLHWNAIIYLWYLAKNDLSSHLLNSDQSKAHQSRTGMKGTMKEQGSLFCLLSVLSQQMSEGGWGQGQKKRERNADSWKECVNRRISLLAGPLCTVRESVWCRCWAPSVPAALAQHHWRFPITVSARLGAVSFPTHVLTDRTENARNSPNSLRAHRNACTSSVAHGVGRSATVFRPQR